MQAGWADIVRGLPRLDDAHAFPAWAYRIITRRCAGRIRSNQRQRALAAALAAEPHGQADALNALHWGLPATTLLLLGLIVKLSMNPMLQANRVLRVLHRLELRLDQLG